MLPNFLIIGAARSGTTSVYSALQKHPDVYLPISKRPEPHFFLKESEYAKGLAYDEQRYFAGWNGERAAGEASTSYLYGDAVPARVAAALPGVKMVCLLRNPIDRAFSGYWHTVASGLETLTFEEALATEADRKIQLAGTPLGEVAPFAYVERGLYSEQLQRWYASFAPSQLHIMLFDDLVAQPQAVLVGLARFLEVDPEFFRDAELGQENASVPEGQSLSPSLHDVLVERFRADVVALERLLDRDLSPWLVARSQQHSSAPSGFIT